MRNSAGLHSAPGTWGTSSGSHGPRTGGRVSSTYQRARDAAVAGLHDFNVRLALMEPPPPEVLALRAAIRGDDLQTSRYMGAVARTIPFHDFFGPENVTRLVGAKAGMDPSMAWRRQRRVSSPNWSRSPAPVASTSTGLASPVRFRHPSTAQQGLMTSR